MDWKLELVVVPVSDVDRAKDFYIEKAGFQLDVDHRLRYHSSFNEASATLGAATVATRNHHFKAAAQRCPGDIRELTAILG